MSPDRPTELNRSSVTHTPGPWEVGGQTTPFDRDIVGPNGEDIGFVNLSDGADDEPTFYPLEANARLIAAAPDMLTELKRLFKLYPHSETADVIAKATGG